jgi:MaoC like domain
MGEMTIEAGQALPELAIDVTTTFVVASAIATRDFQDVHHDRDRAIARGSQDIFLNILTTTGLVQRYVTDWAGPEAIVRKIAIRLGVPCYAGDTLTFSGTVTGEAGPGPGAGPPGSGGDYVIQVVGRCRLGDHVTGTVRLAAAPASAAGARASGTARRDGMDGAARRDGADSARDPEGAAAADRGGSAA